MNKYNLSEFLPLGVIQRLYIGQKRSSKDRGHSPPTYSFEEFKCWVLRDCTFIDLYNSWVSSNFSSTLKPSCDRLDDSKPYTLSNIELVTWGENRNRYYFRVKSGVDCRMCKGVSQYNKVGDLIETHNSINRASRKTGVSVPNIHRVLSGRGFSAGGFLWKYS